MKRIKRIVDTGFWSDEKIMEFTPEDKYFWLFLLTNEYTSQLGIYYLPIKKAAFDLGFPEQKVRELIDRFIGYEMIQFSKKTSEVALKNYLIYSIVSGGKPVYDCLVKEMHQVKDKTLLEYIYTNLKPKDLPNNTVRDFVKNLFLYINNNDNDNDNERYGNESSTNRERIVRKGFNANRGMITSYTPELFAQLEREVKNGEV